MRLNFCENLKKYRDKANLSQQELSDKIHVTRQTVSAWEKGGGKPDIYSVDALCKALSISINLLLYGEEEILKKMDKILDDYYVESMGIIPRLKKGFYNIIDEDLEAYSPFGFENNDDIAELALELHNKGFNVLDLFANGFSVYFKTDEDADRFKKEIYDIFDNRLHMDTTFSLESQELSKFYSEYLKKCMDLFNKKVYGEDFSNYKYYWEDEEYNIRGYGKTEDECREQAKYQECENYNILKREKTD